MLFTKYFDRNPSASNMGDRWMTMINWTASMRAKWKEFDLTQRISSVAIFATGIGILVTVLIAFVNRPTSANVKIANVSADRVENDRWNSPFYPVVSIIMQNDGDSGALITAVHMRVLRIWHPRLMSPINEAVLPSASYSICLSPTRVTPYDVSKKAVPAVSVAGHGGAAQIDVSLCGEQNIALENIYRIQVWLTYDAKKDTAPRDMLVVVPDQGHAGFGYFYADYLRERAYLLAMRDSAFHRDQVREFSEKRGREVDLYNRNIMDEVAKVPGVRSRRMNELFDRSKMNH